MLLHPPHPILMVDDEEAILMTQETVLHAAGLTNTLRCGDATRVLPMVRAQEIEIVLLDLSMPRLSGQDILRSLQQEFPEIPVIIVTGTNDIESAVTAMQAGAFDYMVKAVEESRLLSGVRRAVEMRALRREYTDLRSHLLDDRLRCPEAFAALVTRSRCMHSLFLYAESVARTGETVLVRGETGTGKELIAAALHAASGRTGDLVTVNTAGLDEAMLSDVLFGHRKGAYTGAEESRDGLIKAAAGGTLFLDEIGDLSPASQVKLLRVLEKGEYYPLGSDLARTSACRFVVATGADLEDLMRRGTFRRDLYFRLSTHELRVPALRERKEDLPLLFSHFLDLACRELGKERVAVPPQIMEYLQAYDFPGNVRELRSMVYNAVSTHTSRMLSLSAFPRLKPLEPSRSVSPPALGFPDRLPTIRESIDLLVE
ncbi:MAG TPA: sigma-54 dependent transcriptional regulator, partial [Spirochaetia bacterium]|nr:sigma-54 dependent transcriptional regulator [Spirochaetia bacterium]